MWQHRQWRTGLTWSGPWRFSISNTFTMQSGTPAGPITTNTAASDPQYGPATMVIAGRTVSNPLETTLRFACGTRGDGQSWTLWLTTWNMRVGRSLRFAEFSSLEVALDTFNLNRGAAQQFVSGGNQVNSTSYGQMQNVQTPRAPQISARWHF